MKRTIWTADWHSGHKGGLTPPDWQYARKAKDPEERFFAAYQGATWDWFAETIKALQPIDDLVVVGDAIEGRGEATGGRYLLSGDRAKQIEIAEAVVEQIRPKGLIYFAEGTPYHTGKEESWEMLLARQVGGTFFVHERLGFGALRVDVRHEVPRSVIPHGRFTGPARAAMWSALLAGYGQDSLSQIIVRGHVHYYVQGNNAYQTVLTCPALQAWSEYGERRAEGGADLGFLVIDMEDDGRWTVRPYLMDLRALPRRVLPL